MESETETKFFDFLSKLGYPKSSIIYEPAFTAAEKAGVRYRPDFAILHPSSSEPLAIIEVKYTDNPSVLKKALIQLGQYLDALGDKSIRGYIVAPNSQKEGFDAFTFGEKGEPLQIPSPFFMEFNSLASAHNAEKNQELESERKSTRDHFFIICSIAAVCSILIAIADFFCELNEIKLLTAERMTLIGLSIALIVIPFVEKFKGLGIEIERRQQRLDDLLP